MTRLVVKNKVKHELRGNTILEYHDTENTKPNVQNDNWCTAEFHSNFVQKATFCGQSTERGIFTIWCFGRAGVGAKALQEIAEQLGDYLYDSQTPEIQFGNPQYTTTESDSHGDFNVVISFPYECYVKR